MKIYKYLLLIYFTFNLSIVSFADNIFNYNGDTITNIVKDISVLTDTTNRLTINEIIKKNIRFVYSNKDKKEIHTSFNSSNLWFKFSITNSTKKQQTMFIDVENATIYEIKFYSYLNGKIIQTKWMGIKYPFENRTIKNITFSHKINIAPGMSETVYFQIRSNGDALNFPVILYSGNRFIEKTSYQSIMLGVIIGFICALILIALYSLYLSNKEFTYLYFALYSIFGGLWILNNDGFTYQYIIKNSPWLYDLLIKMIPLTALYLFSEFGLRYLNLKQHSPFFYRIIYWYNMVIFITLLIMPFKIIPVATIVKIETFEIVSITLLNLIAAIATLKANRYTTSYYLSANFILIVGIIIVSFNIVFGYSSVEMRGMVLKIGILFQLTVLLFALTNKIRKSQKMAEYQLQDSKQKYFDILENAIEAIFIIQNKKIKFCNTQLSILTKYRIDELVDFDILQIVHSDDKNKIEALIDSQMKGSGSGKKLVFLSIDKEGFQIWMELISVPIMWEHRPASLNFMNDISQRVLSEKEKEVLEKQLLHAQKMETIGTLAGGIAHDFNNILTPIIGYSELLYNSLEDADMKDDANNILTSANRAKDLVSQILRFSHQIDTTREVINVNNIINEVTKLLEAVIPSSVFLKTQYVDTDCYVLMSPTQLHQVIMNICTNAYQSITGEKGIINVTVSRIESISDYQLLNLKNNVPFIKISIQDNGNGIDPAIKSRIFDPFFTTKNIGEGTGLGLSVVYGIIKNNGGTIYCESTLGNGTRFDILLPESINTNLIEHFKNKVIKGKGEKILIVDDEVKIAAMLKKQLELAGFVAFTENSSLQALELLKKSPEKFDLLITDISMPELTGLELAKQAIELKKDLRCLFITGHIKESYSEKIEEFKHSRLIRKPIDFNLLHIAINELLQ